MALACRALSSQRSSASRASNWVRQPGAVDEQQEPACVRQLGERHDLIEGVVRTTRLATDPLMLMVPDHHQLASRARVEIRQLRDEVFISGTSDDPNRVALASACAGAGFTPHVAFETAALHGPGAAS
jgi:hypothetical protein